MTRILFLIATSYLACPALTAQAPKETLDGSWRSDLTDTQALLLECRGPVIAMKLELDGM